MLPLIQSAHIYWCIYCDELCKRLCLTIPHFWSFFPLVSLAAQWTRAHLEKGIMQLKASLAQGEGALVRYAISRLCLHHLRNICLPENSLHTLPSNFKLFFCSSQLITAIASRRGNHQMGVSFLFYRPKG